MLPLFALLHIMPEDLILKIFRHSFFSLTKTTSDRPPGSSALSF